MSSDGSTYTRLCKSKQYTERRFIARGSLAGRRWGELVGLRTFSKQLTRPDSITQNN